MNELTEVEEASVMFYRAKDYTDLEIASELLENRHGPEFYRLRLAVKEIW